MFVCKPEAHITRREVRFLTFTLVFAACLCSAQDFRTTVKVTSKSEPVVIDLRQVEATDGATITVRNSSSLALNYPQISAVAAPVPYDIESIKENLPTNGTDQEIAIATWKYVMDHTFHYCSAGTTSSSGLNFLRDPVLILNSFGFGCCDQTDRLLVWIWKQLGYKARIALMYFHTVPEIYYDESWHMLDPDHRSFYLRDDNSIASLADILADPEILVRQSVDGLDGVGWSAKTMAALYAENSPTLRYMESGDLEDTQLGLTLRPHEQLTIHSENLAGASQFYNSGDPFSFKNVGSGVFSWDLSFGDSNWKSMTYASDGVQGVSYLSGRKSLKASGDQAGSITYRNSSMFPVLALSILAQATGKPGKLKAYVSSDGMNWSGPAQFQPTRNHSSFQLQADLTTPATGAYSYFIKIAVANGVELQRLRIVSVVQISKSIFPKLLASSSNTLSYRDSSPADQGRNVQITSTIRAGDPEISGLQARSLITESAVYSLARDYGAANLVDHNPDSLAYPGHRQLDYNIDLNGLHHVKSVSIDWGYFGSDSRYITGWRLFGRVGLNQWEMLTSGGFPGQGTTTVPVDAVTGSLRLVAEGLNNVGVFDMRVYGAEIPLVPPSDVEISSNLQTSSPDSGRFPASNLMDGNRFTPAYPYAKNLDYAISFKTPTLLSGATVTWGYFGKNPAYINDWSLLGRRPGEPAWEVLAQGGSPHNASTTVFTSAEVTDVRLVATSTQKFIGVYDLQLFGLPSGDAANTLHFTAVSNQVEATQISSYGAATNLVDGSEGSFAFPGSRYPDYTLDLTHDVYVDKVRMVWGYFGTDPMYIDHWRLLGMRPDSTVWELIDRGDFPDSEETIVPVKNRYSKLRIAADSTTQIGIFEAQVFGVSAQSSTSQATTPTPPDADVLNTKPRKSFQR